MSIDESNAFAALNQLIMPNNMSPSKMIVDEQMMKLLGLPMFNGLQPMTIQTSDHHNGSGDDEKASPSNDSESPRETVSPEGGEDSGISGALSSSAGSRQKSEGWYECFTTTSKAEFEALIYSLYVIDKDDRKLDGWQYFECLHRLQSKCRFKARCKKQDEFYIVEEKCGHNHGIEPVGQAGSHAGLPKTLREIVDKSYNENWSQELRTTKVDDEIRRLGLPPNPRLGRQIDNRIAYLRRVKNLNETKKIQDQISPNLDPNSLFSPQMLQMFLDQNGGSLSIEKDLLNQMMNDSNVQNMQNMQNISTGNENENVAMEVGDDVAHVPTTMTITPDESSNAAQILQDLIKQQQQHQAYLSQTSQNHIVSNQNQNCSNSNLDVSINNDETLVNSSGPCSDTSSLTPPNN